MTDVKIRLKQEGIIRTSGYQVTQWCSVLNAATDPSSYASLFVIRNTEGAESLERIATQKDFVTYAPNELKYFEAKQTGGDALLSAVSGDTLLITPTIDTWLQSQAPYLDCSFVVDQLDTFAQGTGPSAVAGNYVTLPGYTLTNADVGRWVLLTGFSTAGYNGVAQILSVAGSTALVNKTITTNESGSSWALRRVAVRTNAGDGLEPRYFPSRLDELKWELRRNGALVASGSKGSTMRARPKDKVFRDLRFTSVEADHDAANALLSVTRLAVQNLQTNVSLIDTSFLGVQTYNFPAE